MANLNRIVELADVMLSELPPVNYTPTGDFELVPLDFYPPQNKLDDALFSVWCVFQQLQKLKEQQTKDNEPRN